MIAMDSGSVISIATSATARTDRTTLEAGLFRSSAHAMRRRQRLSNGRNAQTEAIRFKRFHTRRGRDSV